MANNAITSTIRIEGVRETLVMFRRLPKEANKSLRERTLELAQALAGKVEAGARSEGAQAALMAPTVRARRDRVPVVVAGGAKRVGRNKVQAGRFIAATEFGSHLPQFKPHVGRGSYWMLTTVEQNENTVADAWRQIAADVARDFSKGGI